MKKTWQERLCELAQYWKFFTRFELWTVVALIGALFIAARYTYQFSQRANNLYDDAWVRVAVTAK